MSAAAAAGMVAAHHHHHHPLRTAAGLAAAAAYPPVLPLMHPALRGLCKPPLGLTAGKFISAHFHDFVSLASSSILVYSLCVCVWCTIGGVSAASLLNRFRPTGAATAAGAGGMVATCGTTGPAGTATMVNLNHQPRRPPNMSNSGGPMSRAGLKTDDYGAATSNGVDGSADPATAAAASFLELYHRFVQHDISITAHRYN